MEKNHTKNKIIEVASKLFGRYGFHKTSMDEIARTARKAKGSLYYHFASKEELFTEVVAKEINDLKVHLSAVVNDENLSAVEKIKRYLGTRMEILSTAVNYHETLKADFFEHFDFIDELRSDLDEWEKKQMKSMVYQGIDENIFDDKYENLDVVLDIIIMVVKGLEIPYFLQGKYEEYALYFDDLIKILTKGLSK